MRSGTSIPYRTGSPTTRASSCSDSRYSVFRAAGFDVFLATELTNIAIRFVGFLLFFLGARRVARLPFALSLLGSILVTLCNGLYVQSTHVQLFTICFAPLLAVLLWTCAEAIRDGAAGRTVLLGGGGALLYGAWAVTTFYTLWFTTLFAVLMAASALAVRAFDGALPGGDEGMPLRPRMIWPALLVLLLFALALIPLIIAYLPKARETGMHPVSSVMLFSPSLLDLLHVGQGNVLFGWLDRLLMLNLRAGVPDLDEHTVGYPPILLLLAIVGGALAWTRKGPDRVFWRALSLASLLSVLLVVHLRGHSAWLLVYRLVPGAKVIRAESRYLLFLNIPAILLAMRVLLELDGRTRPKLSLAIAAVLVLEEMNSGGPIYLDRNLELARLGAVPPVPPGCTSFFARNGVLWGAQSLTSALRTNIDAMLLAEVRRSFTINGDASFGPYGDAVLWVQRPDYPRRVANIARRHGIESGLCALDLAAMRWHIHPFFAPIQLGRPISLESQGTADYLGFGWSDAEAGGTWTAGDEAEIDLVVPTDAVAGPLTFSIMARSLVTPAAPPPLVTVRANGTEIAEWRVGGDPQIYQAAVPGGLFAADGHLALRFGIHSPRVPALLGLNGDRRSLGMLVSRFQLDKTH